MQCDFPIVNYFVLGMQHTWHVHSAFLAKNSLIFVVILTKIFSSRIYNVNFTWTIISFQLLNIWGSKYQGVFTVASLERLDLWRPPLPPPLLPQHHTPSTTHPTTDLTPAPHFPPTSKFKITRITFGIAPRTRDLWGLASNHNF